MLSSQSQRGSVWPGISRAIMGDVHQGSEWEPAPVSHPQQWEDHQLLLHLQAVLGQVQLPAGNSVLQWGAFTLATSPIPMLDLLQRSEASQREDSTITTPSSSIFITRTEFHSKQSIIQISKDFNQFSATDEAKKRWETKYQWEEVQDSYLTTAAKSSPALKLSSLQGDVQEEGHFKETSKKKAKEESGVTPVVIHLGIVSCQRVATQPNPCCISHIMLTSFFHL